MNTIQANLEEVNRRITEAAKKSGRERSDITLVAVTKTHPTEMMNTAIECGVTDICENKPQDVRDKFPFFLPVKFLFIFIIKKKETIREK